MIERSFLRFVLDQLDDLGVEARAMFGGHGLYARDVFFGIVHQGRLYFKTDDASRPDYEECGMEPFQPNDRQTLTRYYEVPADVLENDEQLVAWARAALNAAG